MELNDIDREYLTKLLTSKTLCPVDYYCDIRDKNTPLQCDYCKFKDSCEKFKIDIMVREGAKKILEDDIKSTSENKTKSMEEK